jgi:hypothetical protein
MVHSCAGRVRRQAREMAKADTGIPRAHPLVGADDDEEDET